MPERRQFTIGRVYGVGLAWLILGCAPGSQGSSEIASTSSPSAAPLAPTQASSAATARAPVLVEPDPRAEQIAQELDDLDEAMVEALRKYGSNSPSVLPPDGRMPQAPTALPRAAAKPRRAPSPVRVKIGTMSLVGGPVYDAGLKGGALVVQFRHCVEEALAKDRSALQDAASFELAATIGSDGHVEEARSTGAAGSVVPCLLARVSAARFGPPGDGRATLTIPVTVEVAKAARP
jgi:hypothetical protein